MKRVVVGIDFDHLSKLLGLRDGLEIVGAARRSNECAVRLEISGDDLADIGEPICAIPCVGLSDVSETLK